jgi:hypothetical protein
MSDVRFEVYRLMDQNLSKQMKVIEKELITKTTKNWK